MEVTLFLIAMAVVAAAAVYAPFHRARYEPAAEEDYTPPDARMPELISKKQSILGAIKDLEFDYEQGKLSEEDYLTFRDQHEQHAMAVLREIDELSERLKKEASGRRAKPRARGSKGTVLECPACGEPAKPGHVFCASCGAGLSLVCAACGAEYEAGQRFCSECGASLA